MKKLFYGDNLDVLRKYFKDESVDLCYIDPPFNSKRNYNQIYNNVGSDDKAQAQAFIDTWTWDDEAVKGFEQISENYNGVFTRQSIELIAGLEKVLGKGDLLAYLVSMLLRIAEIQRVLKSTGSFYLHCDPTASHYLKLVCDSIFCAKGGDFKNEIIWHYLKWAVKQRQFVSNHDTVLFYSKSNDVSRIFNTLFVERSPSTKKRFGNAKIVSSHDSQGNRLPSEIKGESIGVAMDDVWDISRVPPIKQLYPTEKPSLLLERIIQASSNEGDLILDAYCGCGTTIAVAEQLKRNWIGIDITYQSISLILKRLEDSFGKEILRDIELNGLPQDFASAVALAHKKEDKTRKEFEKWAVLTYSNNRAMINEKKGADAGIDGIAFMQDRNDKGDLELKRVLFSVKSDKSPHVSYIRDLHGTMEREKAVMGYFITLFPPTKDMVAECKKIGKYTNRLMEQEYPKIEIVTVQDILDGKRITIPTSQQVAVLKSAKRKPDESSQMDLDSITNLLEKENLLDED